VLTETAAIIWYLSEAYGQDHNRLIPSGPQERARYLEWCFFVVGELDETFAVCRIANKSPHPNREHANQDNNPANCQHCFTPSLLGSVFHTRTLNGG
jgi:glutathione S-transferase